MPDPAMCRVLTTNLLNQAIASSSVRDSLTQNPGVSPTAALQSLLPTYDPATDGQPLFYQVYTGDIIILPPVNQNIVVFNLSAGQSSNIVYPLPGTPQPLASVSHL